MLCGVTHNTSALARAAVFGASGYAGAELLRLLASHPAIEVGAVAAESNAGAGVSELFPALAAEYGATVYAASDTGIVDGCDIAFLALPHGASQSIAPELVDRVAHVVDLAADFRLPADGYEQWYGHAHKAPELLDRFAFGLVELNRDAVAGAQHVAVPGCYPTAAALALAPLLASGAVEPQGLVVDALSGVSGAGRALKVTSHFGEVNENASAYGLLTHRHTAEMELALTHVAGTDVTVLFTPHLVPMTRGILATCYARPARAGLTTASLLDEYRAYYEHEPFVIVTDEPSGTRATYGANTAHVTVRADARTGTVLAIAAIDNMVKGAAGQAVQNANILLGLPEPLGLPTIGLVP
jgi:N-acetyl-gamma-glutamyl-phosphate reductase